MRKPSKVALTDAGFRVGARRVPAGAGTRAEGARDRAVGRHEPKLGGQ